MAVSITAVTTNQVDISSNKDTQIQNGAVNKDGLGSKKDTFTLDYASTLEVSARCSKQLLQVQSLYYDVDERGMEWWQKLASLKIPWRKTEGDGRQKRILNDINLELRDGQMLAVLGSSGSGKTSLLDTISCQTTTGTITGKCLINGKERTSEIIKQCSAYVRQNDRLLPHLTVKETLHFVAKLKLPKSWTSERIEKRVDSVIAELGLMHVSDSKVGGAEVRGISGGERRRVSIGIQLLLDPDILFLDEPTSGLDAFTAHHLVETLANLAKNNRIVMLSIHQPRSDIFELFDMMMIMSRGHMVYYGKADRMIGYFTSIGHPCPPLTNPCDFYVDLTTVDMMSTETEQETTTTAQELCTLFQQKQSTESLEEGLHEHIDKHTQDAGSHERLNTMDGASAPSGVDNPAFEIEEDANNATNSQQMSGHNVSRTDTERRVQPHSSSVVTSKDKATKLTQFSVLIRRAFTNNLEDYGFLGIQATEAFFMSLMNGLIFYQMSLDQYGWRDRFGLIYMINALYPYMVILDCIGKCHREKGILYFDMIDGLYTPAPYFFSKILSEVPEHTVFIILYAIPTYFLSGLQLDAGVFFKHLAIVYVTVYCSRALAYLAAALLPTYAISVLFAQSVFTFSLLSCGFIFNLENLFVAVRWTKYISYLKWGFQSLCIAEFRGLNFTCELPPDQQDSCVWSGEQALDLYSLNESEVWMGILLISAITAGLLALFFVVLKYVAQKPHEQG